MLNRSHTHSPFIGSFDVWGQDGPQWRPSHLLVRAETKSMRNATIVEGRLDRQPAEQDGAAMLLHQVQKGPGLAEGRDGLDCIVNGFRRPLRGRLQGQREQFWLLLHFWRRCGLGRVSIPISKVAGDLLAWESKFLKGP